jgi:hypothetical protein
VPPLPFRYAAQADIGLAGGVPSGSANLPSIGAVRALYGKAAAQESAA